jgi:dolichol-phosphate mannosyltransferase
LCGTGVAIRRFVVARPDPPMIVVTLPTWNESENIRPLTEELLALRNDLHVLVVDDNSPDGTWKIAAQMGEANPRVHLLHRTEKKGRGFAGAAGFVRALEMGADWVVEMDADFSHHPRFIPPMLAAAGADREDGGLGDGGADLVVGSRLVKGGGETGRAGVRTLITRGANLYIGLLLRFPIRDCTSGFRLFRGDTLRKINWAKVQSPGPAIVQEVMLACRCVGARMTEVPILFEERRAGESTFNARIALAGLTSVVKLRARGCEWARQV